MRTFLKTFSGVEALSLEMILMDEGHVNDMQMYPLLPCLRVAFSLEQIDSRHAYLRPGISSVLEIIIPLGSNLQRLSTDSLE